MNFALRIALRYLFAKKSQAFISVISTMSIVGVTIGVASLIVAMSVYAGFSNDVREKVLGANAHTMLLSHDLPIFDDIEPILEKLRSLDSVVEAHPFLYSEIMLSSNKGYKGLVLRGIEPHEQENPIALLKNLKEGRIEDLEQITTTQGIIIGEALAKSLSLVVGSRVNLLSPAGQSSAAGFTPKLTPFRVVGIFDSGMHDYDSSLAFVSLSAGQDLLGVPRGRISGVEVILEDPYKAPEISKKIAEVFEPPFFVRDWTSMNKNLLAALELEKLGMYIVLTIVVIIASFSIVTSLIMLVMEKTKDIAIMMSMGASAATIRKIFMLQGSIIGLIGTFTGCALGLLITYVFKNYEIIKLPKGVYPSDTLPVLVLPFDVIVITTSTLILCFLATIYPARQAAKIEPAKALRYE